MLNVNQNKVEAFYDFLDEASLFIFEQKKISYLESLLIASDYILMIEETTNQLEESLLVQLDTLYQNIEDEAFNKEEIRKAFQLALLKAFKHLNRSINDITPDSIGLLFAYFVDLLFHDLDSIDVLDATVGSSNLLLSMMNNSVKTYEKIYGADIDASYLQIALRLANLLEYPIEFFNQNNLNQMLVSPVDLVISDLPIDEVEVNHNHQITYKPYLMIEALMKYGNAGSYFMYTIPADFFSHSKNEFIKEVILKECYIEALIELPISMFKEAKYQKNILILRKKGKGVQNNNEILMLSFPDFQEKEKVMNAIDKINQWFNIMHKK